MKRSSLFFMVCLLSECLAWAQVGQSIQQFGVLPTNSPAENRIRLQQAIDKMWDEGSFNQAKLDELRGQHLRIPYNAI